MATPFTVDDLRKFAETVIADEPGRLGSLVTEAELGDHPLLETAETCLLKAAPTINYDIVF